MKIADVGSNSLIYLLFFISKVLKKIFIYKFWNLCYNSISEQFAGVNGEFYMIITVAVSKIIVAVIFLSIIIYYLFHKLLD